MSGGVVLSAMRREPVHVDFGAIYPGLWVRLRRLTSPQIQAARERTTTTLMAAREGLAALAAYGLDQADDNGRLLNLASPAEMARVGLAIGAVELSIDAVEAWGGVFTSREDAESGTVALIDRPTLAMLLLDDGVCSRLLGEIEKASRLLSAEGNACGSSPDGSSATPRKTTGGRTTAKAASATGDRAPAASAGPRAATARKSPTACNRSKAQPSGASSSGPGPGGSAGD